MDSLHNQPLTLDDMMPTIRQTLAQGKNVTFTPSKNADANPFPELK